MGVLQVRARVTGAAALLVAVVVVMTGCAVVPASTPGTGGTAPSGGAAAPPSGGATSPPPTVEVDGEIRALPPVEIRPTSGVYDYEARYTAGSTRFVTPADLPDETLVSAQQAAVAAHRTLGLRHLSRVDMVVTADGRPVFLEANVAPGMTETSLSPLAFEAAEMTLGCVFSSLVDVARDGR